MVGHAAHLPRSPRKNAQRLSPPVPLPLPPRTSRRQPQGDPVRDCRVRGRCQPPSYDAIGSALRQQGWSGRHLKTGIGHLVVAVLPPAMAGSGQTRWPKPATNDGQNRPQTRRGGNPIAPRSAHGPKVPRRRLRFCKALVHFWAQQRRTAAARFFTTQYMTGVWHLARTLAKRGAAWSLTFAAGEAQATLARGSGRYRPWRPAQAASSVRFLAPTPWRRRSTWCLTVCGLRCTR